MVHTTAKRIGFLEYLVILGVAMAGFAHASWSWVAVGTLALFLLGVSRWENVIIKAAGVDARYRELGRLALASRLFVTGVTMYGKARALLLVVSSKLTHDGLSLGAAFIVGEFVGQL
jgi:hypothetical protein